MRQLFAAILIQVFIFAPLWSEARTRKPAQESNSKLKSTTLPPGGANPIPRKAAPTGGQGATVRVDQAMVYSEPSFDSSEIKAIPIGSKVRVSRRIYGNYFRFFRVGVGKDAKGKTIYGYVADIDLRLDEAEKDPAKKAAQKKRDKEKAEDKKDPIENEFKKPMLYGRYIGLLVGQLNFREEQIRGIDAKEDLLFYGLKITGPDVLMDGPVTDLNIAFHYGAPSYYNSLSSTKPTGYIFLTDFLLVFPFNQERNNSFYLEAGPLVTYSSFKITQNGRNLDLTEINFGASFVAGAAYKLGRFVGRAEYKYMMEKSTHRGFQLVLQHQY